MTNKKMLLMIFTVVLLIVFFSSISYSNAQSCLNYNVTLTNNSKGFVCTYKWIEVNNPTSIINTTLEAKGIIINNTLILNGNSSFNISNVINFGNLTLAADIFKGNLILNKGLIILKKPIFMNFTSFLNYGKIFDKNFVGNNGLGDYEFSMNYNFPNSYAGSGGGSIQNNSADNGGATLVSGGTGYVLCHKFYEACESWDFSLPKVSGNHVNVSLKNYTFNLSLLSSAGGANFNGFSNYLLNGGSGVFPLIIISDNFTNYGLITNKGQSINYSALPYGKEALEEGIVGAGGGGIVEILAKNFIANGSINVSGGKIYISKALNSSLNLTKPLSYNLSDLGDGGSGNVFMFKAPKELLLRSLPVKNTTIYNNTITTKSQNINKTAIRGYNLTTKIANPYGCNTNNIYVNLTVGNHKNNYIFELGQDMLINSSNQNATLSLYGSNPIIKYYKNSSITLANKTFYLPNRNSISINLNINSKNNFAGVLSGYTNHYKMNFNTNKTLKINLTKGNYTLSLYNETHHYNYTFYVSQNCMGYENLSFYPGKQFYSYNGLNISVDGYKTTIYRYVPKVLNKTISNNYYNLDSCNNENLSQIVNLDYKILNSLSAINKSILNTTKKQNYTTLVKEIRSSIATDPKNYNLNSKQTNVPSFAVSGLQLYSFIQKNNTAKGNFVLLSNNASLNISYGNSSIEITLIRKQKQSNIFNSFESAFLKAFEYLPQAFLGVFRVL